MSLKIDSKTFGRDIIAGLTAAIAGIPDWMGYASVAGVPVQIGLYAAPPVKSPVTSFVSEVCL